MLWFKKSYGGYLVLSLWGFLVFLGGSHHSVVLAFAPSHISSTKITHTISERHIMKLHSSIQSEGPKIGFEKSCLMKTEDIAPIVCLKEGTPKEKIVNAWGLYTIFVSLILNPIWALAMTITDAVCRIFPDLDPNRSFYDMTGKIWSKSWLTLVRSYPSVSGDFTRLQENNDLGACLFVANHASWLDIPVLCTVLDPVFKFIAKGELKSVPCIGQQLSGGNHIMIDREDRRSQLRTFKEGVNWLKNGVPLMAFPEGKRSADGKLDKFKGGIFSMAVKAGVPIVPISISNTHAIMPSNALFPIQDGEGKLHVHVHEPIPVEGMKEDELAALVKEVLLSKMPIEQHPLPQLDGEGEGKVSSPSILKKGGESPKELLKA